MVKGFNWPLLFPTDGETFQDVGEYTTVLMVEGAPRSTDSGMTTRSTLNVVSATENEAAPGPSTPQTSGNKYNSYNVKVVKAKKTINGSGKADFISLDNMFIEINSSNANSAYVKSCVQKQWGDDYIVVSKDGLEIGDSPATRGN